VKEGVANVGPHDLVENILNTVKSMLYRFGFDH